MIYEKGRIPGKGRCQWLDFSGMADLAAHLAEKPPRGMAIGCEGAWGGGGHEEALQALRAGDLSHIPLSDAFLAKVESLIGDLMTSGVVTQNAIAGGAPNVGAFLAGSPVNMRRRARIVTPANPVTVLADAWVSAHIPVDRIVRRGAAAMALVRALSASRPVTLMLVCGHGPKDAKNPDTDERVGPIMWSCPVDTAPLDLARACYFLQSPQVLRLHGHRLLARYTNDGSGRAPFDDSEFQRGEMFQHFANRRGYRDGFISLPDFGDAALASDEEAVAWVRGNLERFTLENAA